MFVPRGWKKQNHNKNEILANAGWWHSSCSRLHSQQTFTMGALDEMVSSFNATQRVLGNAQECPSSSSARIMNSYRGHKGGVTCVKFRPLMKHLVSGGSDGSVLMWSLFCRPALSRHHTQIRPYRFLGHQVAFSSFCSFVCIIYLDELYTSGIELAPCSLRHDRHQRSNTLKAKRVCIYEAPS